MAYEKQRYVNGLYTLNNWSDTLKTNNDFKWDNVLKTNQDMSIQKQLETISNFDYSNVLQTKQDLGFTGLKYIWKDKPNNNQNNIPSSVFNANDDTQINSYADVIAMAGNSDVKHSRNMSNAFDNIFERINLLFKDDDYKEFYKKYREVTGQSNFSLYTDKIAPGPKNMYTSDLDKAYEIYKAMKNNDLSKINYPLDINTSDLLNKYGTRLDGSDPTKDTLEGNVIPGFEKYQTVNQYGDSITGLPIYFKTDNNGEIELVKNKWSGGLGERYSDGRYEFDNIGEWLVGDKLEKQYSKLGEAYINLHEDILDVTGRTFAPIIDPNLNAGQKVGGLINNLLVNVGESVDFLTFWKPVIATIADQYNEIKDPGEGFNLQKFWSVLRPKDNKLIVERRRALARYYGMDVNEHGDLDRLYSGRHQKDYEHVSKKLFNIDSTINIGEDLSKILETVGILLNETLNIPANILEAFSGNRPYNTDFGLNFNPHFNFEIDVGDLALEMIDFSFVADGITKTASKAKATKYTSKNARELSENIVDTFAKDLDYKMLPYAKRLELYDYMESYLKNNASKIGSAYTEDFLTNLNKMYDAGDYYKAIDMKSNYATNKALSQAFIDFQAKLGGTIDPKMLNKQILDTQEVFAGMLNRNNANTVLYSVLGGIKNTGDIVERAPLKMALFPVTSTYNGLKAITKRLNKVAKKNVIIESLENSIKTEVGKTLANAERLYINAAARANHLPTVPATKIKKVDKIIKEELLSFDGIENTLRNAGIDVEDIYNTKLKVLEDTIMPDVIDIIKNSKNVDEMTDKLVVALQIYSDVEIRSLDDFIQYIKDMQTELVTDYKLTNYGSAMITSKFTSKYANTGFEKIIDTFEDLKNLVNALKIQELSKTQIINDLDLTWAKNVIQNSALAEYIGLSGSSKKQSAFMWTLSESANITKTGLPYQVSNSKNNLKKVSNDIFGFERYSTGKLNEYIEDLKITTKGNLELTELINNIEKDYKEIKYLLDSSLKNTDTFATGSKVYKLKSIDEIIDLYHCSTEEAEKLLNEVRMKLKGIDARGNYLNNATNTKIVQQYIDMFTEVTLDYKHIPELINKLQMRLSEIKNLNLNLIKQEHTTFVPAKQLTEDMFKAIGIQANVLAYSDEQINELWKYVSPYINENIRGDVGNYFLNANKVVPELDNAMKISTYGEEKIIKAWLSLVENKTENKVASEYLENIYKVKLDANGTLRFSYDYTSDISQGLQELKIYFNRLENQKVDLREIQSIKQVKLENYAARQYLHTHNRGLTTMMHDTIMSSLVDNIINISNPHYATLYNDLGLTKDSPLTGALQELYFIKQGANDLQRLELEVRTSKYLNNNEKKAVLTAIENKADTDFYDIALKRSINKEDSVLDSFKADIKQDIRNHLGYSDIEYEKDNIVSLLHKNEIKFNHSDIETTQGKANKLAELIDTLESKHNKDYKRENIITMDIMSTQEKYGNPISVSISVLDNDGKAHNLFSSKVNNINVKESPEMLPTTPYLSNYYHNSMRGNNNGASLQQKFLKEFTDLEAPTKNIDDVIEEAYKTLSALSQTAKEQGITLKIYGFNNANDILAFRRCATNLHLPGEFNEVLSNIEFIDYLNEVYRPSKMSNFKKLSIEAEKEIDEIIERVYVRAMARQEMGVQLNKRTKIIDGLNLASLQHLSEYIDSPVAQTALLYADTAQGKQAIQLLANLDMFKVSSENASDISTTIYKTINDLVTDFANQTTNIDKTNSFFTQNYLDNMFLSNEEAVRLISNNLKMPLDQSYNSVSQMFNAVSDTSLVFATKDLRNDLFTVLDLSNTELIGQNVVGVAEVAGRISEEINRVKNPKLLVPYHDKLNELIDKIKLMADGEFDYLRTDTLDVKHSWATVKQMQNALEYYINTVPEDILNHNKYKTLLDTLNNFDEDITKLLKDPTEIYATTINWDGSTNLSKFKYNAYIDLPPHLQYQADLEEVSKLSSNLEDVVHHLNLADQTNTHKIVLNSINEVKTPLVSLHNFTVKIQNLEPQELQQYMKVSRSIRDFNKNLAPIRRMGLDDENLLKYLIANTSDHFFILDIPKKGIEGADVGYPEAFKTFMARKAQLKEIGINLKEHGDKLEVSLDYDMYKGVLKKNKNYDTKHYIKYTLNGEEVVPVLFGDISEEEKQILYTITQNKEIVDEFLDVKKQFTTLDPRLEGLTGELHSEQFWQDFKNTEFVQDLEANKWINNRDVKDFGDMYNEWDLGLAKSTNSMYPQSTHELNILTALGNRIAKSHEDYAEVINWFLKNNSDLSFKGTLLKNMNTTDINNFLKNNPDYSIVIPKQHKAANRIKAQGGVALDIVPMVTKKNRKLLEEGGALLLPRQQTIFVRNITNNFTFGNPLMRQYSAMLGKLKAMQISYPGAQIKNVVDTELKSYGSIGNSKLWADNNIWAMRRIIEYKQICMDIKQATGKLDSRSIDLYFNKGITKNPIMNREAFNIIDSYYRISGEVIDGDADFISKILRPTSFTEEVNRIATYKSFMDQGKTVSEAFDSMMNLDQYLYTTNSYSDLVMKTIIPYYTYLTNQTRWFLERFTEQPHLFKFISRAYENHWEQDERFDNENVWKNRSLLYAKYSGNLLDKNSNLTLKIGPSMFDSIALLASPETEVASRLNVPIQAVYNSIMHMLANKQLGNIPDDSFLGQYLKTNYATYDFKAKKANTGIAWIDSLYNWMQDNTGGTDTSIQSAANGKYSLIKLLAQNVPFIGAELLKIETGIRNFERTGKWESLFLPSVFGSITDYNKKEYVHKTYQYPTSSYTRKARVKKPRIRKTYPKKTYAKRSYAKRSYSGTPRVGQVGYYQYDKYGNSRMYYGTTSPRHIPYGNASKYYRYTTRMQYPNSAHYAIGKNNSGHLQSIPQYLYSYMGKNRYGRSKLLSWQRMSTQNKVKSTLRRLAKP